MKTSNPFGRSDTAAKNAYVNHLCSTGLYKSIQITKTPADITAITLDGITHYYEVKFTSLLRKNKKSYLGAATTTEWRSAFFYPNTFWFVIAIETKTGEFEFDKYIPADFAKISYPRWNPQIFFNYDMKSRCIPERSTEITPDFIHKVSSFFDLLREESIHSDFSI